MKDFRGILKEEEKIKESVDDFFYRLNNYKFTHGELGAGIKVLENLKKDLYEDINQILHEKLLLDSIKLFLFLNEFKESNLEIKWNPRQTGGREEPDAKIKILESQKIFNLEVTASLNPVGAISKKMKKTLEKLSRMEGENIYFIKNSEMELAALKWINKNNYKVKVLTIKEE